MWAWVLAWVCVWVGVVVGEDPSSPPNPGYLNYSTSTNITTTYNTSTTESPPPTLCEEARIKCALRKGCGMALQNYMLGCADILSGRSTQCDRYCRNTLVALMSAEEGIKLMDCHCSDNYCRESKERVEVCRAEVETVLQSSSSQLSCSLAHWICSADTLCGTAIDYYGRHCRRMFNGKGCSVRCNNSIAILQRQAKAEALQKCQCDGSEPFACQDIKNNMARFCFHEIDEAELEREEESTNHIDTSAVSSRAALSMCPPLSQPPHILTSALTLLLCLLWSHGYRR